MIGMSMAAIGSVSELFEMEKVRDIQASRHKKQINLDLMLIIKGF
jgi:hypothetical protein